MRTAIMGLPMIIDVRASAVTGHCIVAGGNAMPADTGS
jgi:hypothetical protein